MSEADALSDGDGPGLALCRARESRGWTQQQAAEQLNLDVSLVEAIERDDYAKLGAPVFAKGHLRRYGAMLGLAADELIAAYERVGAQPAAPTLVPRARQEMQPVRGRPKWPLAVGGVLLFVLAAGMAAYVAEHGVDWRMGSGGSTDAGQAGEPVLPAPAAPAADAPGERRIVDSAMPGLSTTPPEVAAAASSDDAAPAPTVPPGHVSISLAFATDSWAEVYDGSGQAVLYDLGRAGTQRSIAAAAPLSVTIGNAPGVTLAVNGRPVTLPAVAGGGTVARFRIEADGTVR